MPYLFVAFQLGMGLVVYKEPFILNRTTVILLTMMQLMIL
ncbi:MAG: hypothetical protein RL248_207 [Pseudomonadota bacterium]